MVVGICRIAVMLPHNDSLKGKRAVIRKILDRTRARFNVAAAEVGNMDDRRRALLGFAVVSNDRRHANAMLDNVARFAETSTQAVIMDRSLELIQVGDEELSTMGLPDLDEDAQQDDPWSSDDKLPGGDETP